MQRHAKIQGKWKDEEERRIIQRTEKALLNKKIRDVAKKREELKVNQVELKEELKAELITRNSKLRLSKDPSTGISYVQAPLSNTILKDIMHSHNLADSAECDCSLSRGILEHFICWYPLIATERHPVC